MPGTLVHVHEHVRRCAWRPDRTYGAGMPPRRVLVTGATGYVGGRLVSKLIESGYSVRVLVRSAARARRQQWSDDVEMVVGDVLEAPTLTSAFEGCEAAYHLVHAMGTGSDFDESEARAAENVRDAAAAAQLSRIVYLGGMGDDSSELSAHLTSRHRVGQILASGPTPVTELRAAVIIGSGSLSFEMLRYLTEVLPVMITPSWVRTKCQPIAIRDVLHYLVGVLDDTSHADHVVDIGGPDVLTYADMMRVFAEVAGLPRRVIIPVPLLSPRLSSLWIGLVTPLPARTARPLVDSLRHEVTVQQHGTEAGIEALVPHEPLPFREAVELALRRTRAEAVDTRWSDAGFTPADPLPGDPEWSGGASYTDHQVVTTAATPEQLHRSFARIGGTNGYYVADWAWWLRGLADRIIGGPGLRRGRRHPVELRAGESLDFWRVVEVDDRQLVLQAEMKVPGKAWLTWRIEPDDDDTDISADTGTGQIQLHQVAFFAPKGLFGRLYWYTMLPFHWLIFRRMALAIVSHAEREQPAAVDAAT
jgi:uncharacterized protein YbjT (DUF2867 family)